MDEGGENEVEVQADHAGSEDEAMEEASNDPLRDLLTYDDWAIAVGSRIEEREPLPESVLNVMEKVFQNDMLVENILEKVILMDERAVVRNCRLVSKQWYCAISKLYRRMRKPLFVVNTSRDAFALNEPPRPMFEQQTLLYEFLRPMTRPSRIEGFIPTFALHLTPQYFRKCNYNDLVNCLVQCGPSLVELFISFPKNSQMSFLLPPGISLPNLKTMGVSFTSQTLHTSLHVIPFAHQHEYFPNYSSVHLVQAILNAASNLRVFRFMKTITNPVNPPDMEHLYLPENLVSIQIETPLRGFELLLRRPFVNLAELTLNASLTLYSEGDIFELLSKLGPTLRVVNLTGNPANNYRHSLPVKFPRMHALTKFVLFKPWEFEERNPPLNFEEIFPKLEALVFASQTEGSFNYLMSGMRSTTITSLSIWLTSVGTARQPLGQPLIVDDPNRLIGLQQPRGRPRVVDDQVNVQLRIQRANMARQYRERLRAMRPEMRQRQPGPENGNANGNAPRPAEFEDVPGIGRRLMGDAGLNELNRHMRDRQEQLLRHQARIRAILERRVRRRLEERNEEDGAGNAGDANAHLARLRFQAFGDGLEGNNERRRRLDGGEGGNGNAERNADQVNGREELLEADDDVEALYEVRRRRMLNIENPRNRAAANPVDGGRVSPILPIPGPAPVVRREPQQEVRRRRLGRQDEGEVIVISSDSEDELDQILDEEPRPRNPPGGDDRRIGSLQVLAAAAIPSRDRPAEGAAQQRVPVNNNIPEVVDLEANNPIHRLRIRVRFPNMPAQANPQAAQAPPPPIREVLPVMPQFYDHPLNIFVGERERQWNAMIAPNPQLLQADPRLNAAGVHNANAPVAANGHAGANALGDLRARLQGAIDRRNMADGGGGRGNRGNVNIANVNPWQDLNHHRGFYGIQAGLHPYRHGDGNDEGVNRHVAELHNRLIEIRRYGNELNVHRYRPNALPARPVSMTKEKMQQINVAFINLTKLKINIGGPEICGLKYIFEEMKSLQVLKIAVEKSLWSIKWDSLLTGIPVEFCDAIRSTPEIWDEVYLHENQVSIRGLSSLQELGILECTNTTGSDYDRLGELLISDVSFHFALLKMRNLKFLELTPSFTPSSSMFTKWYAEKGQHIELRAVLPIDEVYETF